MNEAATEEMNLLKRKREQTVQCKASKRIEGKIEEGKQLSAIEKVEENMY